MADYNALTVGAGAVAGAGQATRTVAVSRSGADERAVGAFDVVLGPDEILAAWSEH
jgi:hypothetical protein